MGKYPIFSGKDVINRLSNLGFEIVGQKGSHVKLKKIHCSSKRTVIVPLHKELAPGTLALILRQANITIEELTKK